MKIIIRADGGSTIGMGHIMRTMVLAQQLKAFSDVWYVCKKGNEFQTGVNYLVKHGYKVLLVKDADMIGELKNISADCLITDSYDVDEKYFEQTKELFRVTGYIDDLNKHRFNVDFLINQNIYANDMCYQVPAYAKLFLGSSYLLLRDEFLDLPQRKIAENMKHVMITMGGADPLNLSEQIAKQLITTFSDLIIHIVIGPSFTHKKRLQSIQSERIQLHENAKMSSIMQKSDVAIAACGSTEYELAACGTPTIGIVTADNQKMAAQKMKDLEIISYVEHVDDISDELKTLGKKKREQMTVVGQRIVDGLGSKRLSHEIYKLLYA